MSMTELSPPRHPPAVISRAAVVLLSVFLLTACSVKQMAVNVMADSLSEGGGVYASDDDPELVYEAIPFGLKTYESLLEVSPEHRGLLLASAEGFAGYAYLTREKAERLDRKDVIEARYQRARASRLFLRARDYALRALELDHPGLSERLREDGAAALAATTVADIDGLYWAGAAWAGAVGSAKDDLDLIAQLPMAAALVERVIELDASYDRGAAQEFMIAYEGGRPGGSAEAARGYYGEALALSQGQRASVHLALAEAVVVPEQDLAEFKVLLAAARDVDPAGPPDNRLVNAIALRRADWLEARIPELFLELDIAEAGQ
jgi:hypothetical protein